MFGIAEGVKVQKINNKLHCPLQGHTNARKQLLESPQHLQTWNAPKVCDVFWNTIRNTLLVSLWHSSKGALVSSVKLDRHFIEMNCSSSGKCARMTFSLYRKISFWFNEMFYQTHVILFACLAISVLSSTSFVDIYFLLYLYQLCSLVPFQLHK